MSVYLDYNASAPIDHRVLEYMDKVYLNNYGNPDSRTHNSGNEARNIVENSRKQVASLIGCNTNEIVFTSGATESNNIALLGLRRYADSCGKKHIITTAIEHKAIIEATKKLTDEGFDVEYVLPSADGKIRVNDVIDKVRDDTLLVSIMHANNETGIIQPVKEIGDELKNKRVLFHIDATQTCGKLVEEIKGLSYDMMSIAGHKMAGPQGIGALIIKANGFRRIPVEAIMYGGKQEHGIRPGTVPTALVAGLGKAASLCELEYIENNIKTCNIKEKILSAFSNSGLKYSIIGDQNACMTNTVNICIRDVSSEALMLATRQYCDISNGSACNSNDYKPSYVLAAMGMDESDILNSIRISWGPRVSLEDVLSSIEELINMAKKLV